MKLFSDKINREAQSDRKPLDKGFGGAPHWERGKFQTISDKDYENKIFDVSYATPRLDDLRVDEDDEGEQIFPTSGCGKFITGSAETSEEKKLR